jgi:hypothetical protein
MASLVTEHDLTAQIHMAFGLLSENSGAREVLDGAERLVRVSRTPGSVAWR